MPAWPRASAGASTQSVAGSSLEPLSLLVSCGLCNPPTFSLVLQVAGRFELRLGCYLIHEALKICGARPTGQKSDASAYGTDHAGNDGASRHSRHAERPAPSLPTRLMLLEVLLDYERPQRWRKLEASLWKGLASLTLEGLKNLVLAW